MLDRAMSAVKRTLARRSLMAVPPSVSIGGADFVNPMRSLYGSGKVSHGELAMVFAGELNACGYPPLLADSCNDRHADGRRLPRKRLSASKRRRSTSCTRRSGRARPPASPSCSTTSTRVRAFNGVASLLVTEDGAPVPPATGTVRGRRAARASRPRRSRRRRSCPISTSTRARRSNSAAWSRPPPIPSVQQQFGMIVGMPERRPGQRARHAQHPRRALGHLPRRLRPASVARAAAARRAAGVRGFPPAARRARARRRARRQLRPQSRSRRRCRCTASCSRSRIRSTPRTCARPAAATRAYDIDFPARDHVLVEQLRNKGAIIFAKAREHRIQRPRRRSGRPAQAGQGAALDARLSAQHLGRQSVQPLRHHALGLARLELGLGACRSAPTW